VDAASGALQMLTGGCVPNIREIG